MWWAKEILNTQHLSDFHIFNNLKLLPPPARETLCLLHTKSQLERRRKREQRDRHQTAPPRFLMADCWHGTFILTVRTGSKEIFYSFLFLRTWNQSFWSLYLHCYSSSLNLRFSLLSLSLLPSVSLLQTLDLSYHQPYIKENHHHQLHTRLAGSRESSSETKGPYVTEAALLACHH